jgi:hypothetical protein
MFWKSCLWSKTLNNVDFDNIHGIYLQQKKLKMDQNFTKIME